MKFTLVKSTLNHQLITIKALKAIKEAEIIITDPHTDYKIIDIARTKAIIYKREGNETLPHLLDKLNFPKTVIQLTEERSSSRKDELHSIEFFKKRGYETHIIPGISSINAISGKNHFPLTIRGRNESFWVYDSESSPENQPLPMQQLAAVASSNATIVITNPGQQLKTAITIVRQHRCASTSVLLCTKDNTFISTNLKSLTDSVLQQLYKNSYMIVINPESVNGDLALQINSTEIKTALQSLLAV